MDLATLVNAKTHVVSLKGRGKLSDVDRTSVTTKQMVDSAVIVAKVVSAHAGKYYNGGVFTPRGMKAAMKTWPKCPVLDASHYGPSIGTVVKGEYRDISGGKKEFEERHSYNLDAGPGLGEEILWLAIHDAKAAEKVIQGRINRLSVGRYPDKDNDQAEVCSICGSPSIGRYCCNGSKGDDTEDNMKIHHYYGEKYKVRKDGKVVGEQKAYSILDSWSNVHVAFIEDGYAGDPMTGVEEITVVGKTGETTEDSVSNIELYAVWKDGSRIQDLFDPTSKNILDVAPDRALLLDSLSTGPLIIEQAIPTIYPIGGTQDKLNQDQFSLVKGILGDKAITTKDREKLPDNAYAGPGRTFLAHNPSYVQAGLALLKSGIALDQSTRDEVYYELRRREHLHGCDRSYTSKLTDEGFNKAHVIYSLDKAGCLANEEVKNDSDYQLLLTDLKEGNVSFDRLRQLMGSDGVGPNGCLPSGTEFQKKASVKALVDGLYRGPVKPETLMTGLGADPSLLKSEQKDKLPAKATTMEINLQSILDFLASGKATEGDFVKISESAGVGSVLAKKIKDAVDKTTELKDKEISSVKDELTRVQATIKDRLVDEIIAYRTQAGKLPETVKDRASEAYKAAKADLEKKSLDALTAIHGTIVEFLPTPTKDSTTPPPKPSNPPVEGTKDGAGEGESNSKKGSGKSGMGWDA